MQRSVERILTTHTGSLPRPAGVPLAGTAAADGDTEATEEQLRQAVDDVVARQAASGVDVVNDGELSKPSYATYVVDRLTGFGGAATHTIALQEAQEFPEYFERLYQSISSAVTNPACTGPVSYRDRGPLERDIANLLEAAKATEVTEAFMTAASPGVIALFMANQYYPTEEEYIWALADAMKVEYDAIAGSGLILQIDCPDLAAGWPTAESQGMTIDDFRVVVAQHIEALNHTTRDIGPERIRMHMCWGNYEGPHHHDLPLASVIDLVLAARPLGLLFEAANPRHEHEWAIFDDIELPEGKLLIPGVIDSTNNYIEHPELIAQRLERLARLVGRENVVAGSDCGFATFAQVLPVDPKITWAKLASMAEGARLASQRLWSAQA